MLRSALHDWHVARAARFANRDGWTIPSGYAGTSREIQGELALADLSHGAKLLLRPSSRASDTQAVLGDIPAPAILEAKRLNHEIVACRLAAEEILFLSSTPRLELRYGNMDLRCSPVNLDPDPVGPGLVALNQTFAFAGMCLVGDEIESLFRQISAIKLPEPNTCAQTRLSGIWVFLVRLDELSQPSLRIYVSWEFAQYLCETLVGLYATISPMGIEEWESLRKD